MEKKLPDSLVKYQQEKREKTLNRIQLAIDALKEEGTLVTKKLLIELTELSASTFSKEHVKELLQENEVCQYRPVKAVSNETRKQIADEKLVRQMERMELQNNKLKDDLVDKDIYISKLEEDLKIEREKNERLYGKIHNLNRQMELNGISPYNLIEANSFDYSNTNRMS